MRWIYRFAANADYPEPVEEISDLSAMCSTGHRTFLLLNRHKTPPMSGASPGRDCRPVYIKPGPGHPARHGGCGGQAGGPSDHTIQRVQGLYGILLPIGCSARSTTSSLLSRSLHLADSILSVGEQTTFLKGQATAKLLGFGRSVVPRLTPTRPGGTFSGFDGRRGISPPVALV